MGAHALPAARLEAVDLPPQVRLGLGLGTWLGFGLGLGTWIGLGVGAGATPYP